MSSTCLSKKGTGIFFKLEHFSISPTFSFCTDVLENATSYEIIPLATVLMLIVDVDGAPNYLSIKVQGDKENVKTKFSYISFRVCFIFNLTQITVQNVKH